METTRFDGAQHQALSGNTAADKTPGAARREASMAWLMKLRLGACVGQIVAIAVVTFGLRLTLPLSKMLAVWSISVISNGAFFLRASMARRHGDALLAGALLLDVGLATVLMALAGGAANPFHFVYVVHLALAAVILPSGWLMILIAFTALCYTSLFFVYVPLPSRVVLQPTLVMLEGNAAAFYLAAFFITYFVRRLTVTLATSQQALAQAQSQVEREERLSSLATLAAGAAHEMATPLATIAVVAKELERQIGNGDGKEAQEDARLIRREVERCRVVLSQMACDAGAEAGEAPSVIFIDALLLQAIEPLSAKGRVDVQWCQDPDVFVDVPERSIAGVLRGIIKNALEADCEGHIAVVVERRTVWASIEIIDHGPPIPAEVMARLGEPFFTTKGPKRGMGLGLFLARTVIERLGGTFALGRRGKATVASVCLPLAEAAGARQYRPLGPETIEKDV